MNAFLAMTPESQAAQVAMTLGNDRLFHLRDFVAHAIQSATAVADALAVGDLGAAKLMLDSHDARLRILLLACDKELERRKPRLP